jgi:hypothetical protein
MDAVDKTVNVQSFSEISAVASTGSSLFSVSFVVGGEGDKGSDAKKD